MASNTNLRNHHEHLQRDNHTRLVPNPTLVPQQSAVRGHPVQASESLGPTALCPVVTRVTIVYWYWNVLNTALCMKHQCGDSKTGQPLLAAGCKNSSRLMCSSSSCCCCSKKVTSQRQ